MTPTLVEKLHYCENQLNTFFVERADEIHAITLAITSGTNLLLLGPPGTGKSYLVTSYQSLIHDAKKFDILLTKFTTPEEVFGPHSLSALQENRYSRIMKNYLPEADLAFLDEVFKASSAILNSLLLVMNERKFKDDGQTIKIPLLSLIGASNEIPEESDGLAAVFDRFHLKYLVKPIQERNNRVKMLMAPNPKFEPVLSFDDIMQIRSEIEGITMSIDLAAKYSALMDTLQKEGLAATDRSYRTSLNILKAEAYFNGRTEVKEDDFDLLQHVLWTDPDHRKKLYSFILAIINPQKNKIMKLWDAATDVYENIEKAEDTNKQVQFSIEAANKLKDIKNEIMEIRQEMEKLGKEVKQAIIYEDELDKMLKHVFRVYLGTNSFS